MYEAPDFAHDEAPPTEPDPVSDYVRKTVEAAPPDTIPSPPPVEAADFETVNSEPPVSGVEDVADTVRDPGIKAEENPEAPPTQRSPDIESQDYI